ncbi:hypothetical protein TWF225_006918 [Orbilia oligospora]|uniref:Uncharacterized protein n=1 Tax=Orbilia oligospora TaxID=2813651 RepID=A0A7C8TZZ9_ORBOL|nr:hypothetical protein TWF751_008346 [Orbilia oligospora]KAF3194371.1 hypothetical protein TWF225_006918 [Orbilia oligospora]KAF3246209.1 hypothetical protein TWF128_009018 [Orbilia oligospora]KAF3264122.1 hypothetical protein TWF217_003278 [Orbilia oligospora]TGJ68544.1 hypothetical protein EYR41_007589 [Orbilia oligospora]
MGRVYYWTEVEMCPKREQLKEGMRRLIIAIQMFRTALVSTRAYFTQTVYPTPAEGLQAHHQLVFQTSVALHTQNRIISQAAKLIRYVRRTHFDKHIQKWDDEDLKTLSIDLHEQVTDCTKENQEMLDEMGTKFSVQIRYYDANGNEEVGVNRHSMDTILENGMHERRVDNLTTEYRF